MANIKYAGRVEDYNHLVESGYEFHLPDYFKRGWEIYKRFPLGFAGYIGIVIILFIVASLLLEEVSLAFGGLSFSSYLAFIPNLAYYIISLGIQYCMIAGFYIVGRKIDRDESYGFGNFFDGFQHFSQLLVGSLLVYIITLIAFSLFLGPLFYGLIIYGETEFIQLFTENFNSQNAILGLIAFLIVIAPGMYITVAYSMVIPLIVFGKLEAWKAMEVSRKVVSKRWGSFFSFYVGMFIAAITIGMFVAIAPILAVFFVLGGIFIAAPVLYITLYAIYADIFDINSEEELELLEEIGSLIDEK